MISLKRFALLALLLGTLVSCKDSQNGTVADSPTATTTTPTPVTVSTSGPVTLKSKSISVAAANVNGGPQFAVTGLSGFKFCITQIKMLDGSGASVQDASGASALTAVLGLIDVSAGTAINWGTITVPTGFTLGELAVEVHKDPENCSQAAYSLSYNGQQLSKDLEFKIKFNPAIQLDSNDIVGINLDTLVTTFKSASAAGALTDEGIGAYVESMTAVGSDDTSSDTAASIR